MALVVVIFLDIFDLILVYLVINHFNDGNKALVLENKAPSLFLIQ